MLERDFEIKSCNYFKDGKKIREYPKEKEYDFYLVSWGRVKGLKLEWPLNHSCYLGIRILNEDKRKQAEEFFYKFPKGFEEELGKLSIKNNYKSEGTTPQLRIQIPWLKQKMIEEFYPTREEMLERDFEVRTIKNRVGDEYDAEADFYLRNKETGYSL